MTVYTSSIVGAHFRPPAKQILAAVESGVNLFLVREPDNQYDPNAMQVCILSSEISADAWAEIEPSLANYGLDLAEAQAQDFFHLGYVPAKDGKPDPLGMVSILPEITQTQADNDFLPIYWPGKLTFNGKGASAVDWDTGVALALADLIQVDEDEEQELDDEGDE